MRWYDRKTDPSLSDGQIEYLKRKAKKRRAKTANLRRGGKKHGKSRRKK